MTLYKIKLLIAALIVITCNDMFGQIGGSNQKSLEPFSMLGMYSDSLTKAKPGGEVSELTGPAGQKFSVVNYTEDWFGLEKIKAKYFIGLKKVVQISLTLPKNIKRDNTVNAISNYLGKPYGVHIAKKDTMPKYSAQWVSGAVSYGLNDYGDSSIVFITKSMLYNYNVYYLPAGSYIIQKISAEVTGDAIKDEISLIGHRFDESTIYFDKLFFIIKDGKTKKENVTNFPQEFNAGYAPAIKPVNVTNKKYQEIFVSAPTGGSGGIINYLVYSFKNNKANVLFSPDSTYVLGIDGKFLDDYKISFTIRQTDKNYNLSVVDYKDKFDELKVYDLGKLQKDPDMLWINNYGMMETKDTDHDGVMELVGTQAVKGVANYITVANAQSIWKYKKGKFELISADVIEIKR
jgi:hypothetical protein